MSGLALPKPEPRPKKARRPIVRTTRPSKIRKTARGKAKASLDSLFSRVIRLRDPFCRIGLCKPTAPSTDAAHLFPKSIYPRLRYCLTNAVGACRSCHRYMTDRSATWYDWRIAFLSQQQRDYLGWLDQGPKPDLAETRATLSFYLRSAA